MYKDLFKQTYKFTKMPTLKDKARTYYKYITQENVHLHSLLKNVTKYI